MIVLGEIPPLPTAAGAALVLAVREALLNVEKHADARSVVVSLFSSAAEVGVAVVDDGDGEEGVELRDGDDIDQTLATGLGLLSVRERLERVGGRLALTTNEGPGMTLRAWVSRS